jgi:hypothetical protein
MTKVQTFIAIKSLNIWNLHIHFDLVVPPVIGKKKTNMHKLGPYLQVIELIVTVFFGICGVFITSTPSGNTYTSLPPITGYSGSLVGPIVPPNKIPEVPVGVQSQGASRSVNGDTDDHHAQANTQQHIAVASQPTGAGPFDAAKVKGQILELMEKGQLDIAERLEDDAKTQDPNFFISDKEQRKALNRYQQEQVVM